MTRKLEIWLISKGTINLNYQKATKNKWGLRGRTAGADVANEAHRQYQQVHFHISHKWKGKQSSPDKQAHRHPGKQAHI
jgi:hypothetical protein